MYPMLFMKRGTSSRLTNNNLGASPPLILGFHPSKRHAALIAEAFFMASSTSYLDVHSMAFSRFVVLCCLSSTNIMLSLRDHVIILY